jgi:chemotaxis protein CheY-P-specific phosphatase CheC
MPSSRTLPDWLSGFMEMTEESEPPFNFRLWTGISVIAAALQRKCYTSLGPKEAGALVFYPNLYILLVGPSGVRKGTAMGPGFKLLSEVGNIEISSQATTLQQLIRKMKDINYSHHDPLTGTSCFHASLTIFSKEFTVFLGYQNHQLMSHLCDWYDCEDEWTYETVSRAKEKIIGVWLNIIGATTPALIQSSLPLDAIGGGLTSRTILVYEEKKGKFIEFPFIGEKEKKLYTALKNDLEKIYLLRGNFKFTKEFIELWSGWRQEQERQPPNFHDQRFDGYISRRPNHIMKLSMVVSASARDDLVLREQDFIRAREILHSTEHNMPRVFSGVGKSDLAAITSQVAAFIATKKTTSIDELMNVFVNDIDIWSLEMRVLRTLESMGKIKIINGRQITWKET